MDQVGRPPGVVRGTLWLEQVDALDRPVRVLEPWIRTVFGTGTRGALLRGEWFGHALHPLLTDLAVGTWTSASLLDVLGGPESSLPAQRLVGAGLVAAAPTAWTGWAEWTALSSRDKRVGLVHAVTNGVAIGAYAGSWLARRRGDHGTGARLALAGAAVASFGAYLGGHLTEGRRVASHHPAYDEPGTNGGWSHEGWSHEEG
ncbi:DUF2231 domain-containing protein [Nocardioides panaciterrulae]|uniref:DUF2231 domain-containing protein n=1 Tax=Nocardioides panaciterrulae TaxID=661492 RepID=A0A7Y9E4A2_9ACTN|nr:DUF2231 domain-containing protein [Nocardioides panaciterrulae]NYD40909.1 hypothetical protein [Nocardioides panaciterrulae]